MMSKCSTNPPDKSFIFSGQSNATNIGLDVITETPNSNVLMFDRGRWIRAQNPFPGEMMSRVHRGISAWPAMGDEYEKIAHRRVFLSGYANSGQNISHWDAESTGWRELYSEILHGCITHTTFIWYQGESDSTTDRKIQYAMSLRNLISRLQKECKFENIVIVTLGDVNSQHALNMDWDFAFIRNAQHSAIAGAIIVPAEDLPLQDNVHLTSQSLVELGKRIAHAISSVDKKNRIPEVFY